MVETPKWPELASGQKGTNVKALQLLLRYRGANISADGDFGTNTYNAVLSFQTNNGLRYKDGVAGQETLSALITTIKSRTINDAAWAAQNLLGKFENLTIDSDFWTGSEKATRDFQTKMGFLTSDITGTVTPITWRYLFGYSSYPSTGGGTGVTGNVYASVAMTNSTLTNAQMKENAKYVYSYLQNQGFSKQAACAVIGNMQKESDVDPGVWQSMNDVTLGYGLLQWDDATKFLNDAVANGRLANANPETANSLARSNPKALMDAELDFFIRSCAPGAKNFFYPAASMQHTGYNMTFSNFKVSTMDVETLAIVFHDHYERSRDGSAALNERKKYARDWFSYL